MKKGSDNFRYSAIFDIIEQLQIKGVRLIIYEPLLNEKNSNLEVVNDLICFKKLSDIIVANRYDDELYDVIDKVYTKDIYFRD